MPMNPDTPASPALQALVSYLEHEPQPSIVLDLQYNILAANTAYLHQFGVVGAAPIGQKLPASANQLPEPWQAVSARGSRLR